MKHLGKKAVIGAVMGVLLLASGIACFLSSQGELASAATTDEVNLSATVSSILWISVLASDVSFGSALKPGEVASGDNPIRGIAQTTGASGCKVTAAVTDTTGNNPTTFFSDNTYYTSSATELAKLDTATVATMGGRGFLPFAHELTLFVPKNAGNQAQSGKITYTVADN